MTRCPEIILASMRLKRRGVVLVALSLLLLLGACGVTPTSRGGSGLSSADGFIYVTSRQGQVFALNLEQREKRLIFPASGEWKYPTEGKGMGVVYGNPTLADGKIYVGTLDGVVYSLDRATGRELWRKSLGGAIVGRPEVAGERLLVGAGRKLYALDLETSQLLWPEPFTTKARIWASPVVGGDKVFVASMDHSIYAVDVATGKLLWGFPTQGALFAPPVLEGDRLYVGSFDGSLYAVEDNQGQLAWPQPFRAGSWLWTQPLFSEGNVIAGTLDNKVYAIDAGSGGMVWERPFDSDLITAAVAEGRLILGFRNGQVLGLDAATGQQRWQFNARSLVQPELLVQGGLVYVATEGSIIYAIDASTGVELWEFSLRGS
ncbi:MAG: PQQ-binding-like beta-propeller repeat protein [Chloroflexota bacterium]